MFLNENNPWSPLNVNAWRNGWAPAQYTGTPVPRRLLYNQSGNYYNAGKLADVTVTGHRKKPYWVSARTKLLQPSELLSPLSAVGNVVSKGVDLLPGGRYVNEYIFPALSIGNWMAGSGNPYKGAEIRANDERLLGAWLPLDFFGPSILGKGVKTTFNAGVNTAARMGNNTAKALAVSRELNRAIEDTSPRVTIPRSKNLFRTTVYKGGDITDPHSTFFTTDRLYASKYGPVTPYLFESKAVARAREPLMGARDPVSMDMFVYNNTKNNPNATAIIGHDAVTGEFTPSRGMEIYSMSPRNIYPIQSNEPLTSYRFFERYPSRISQAERTGVPKVDRNFRPRLHVANYPGYLLRGLMAGSPLERLLSKNGTININLLNAYFNKASLVEREVVNKVLSEKFAGLKTIDYNLFKKAILDELIGSYNRVPLTEYADYGVESLGYRPKLLADAVTYDDKGVRIPLGERDNFKLNDIRYSWLPWFLGGSTAAGTLYGNRSNPAFD